MTFLAWNPTLRGPDAETSRLDIVTRQAVPVSDDVDNTADTPPDWNEPRQDDDRALPGNSRRFQAPDTEDAHEIGAWWADLAQQNPDASTHGADKGEHAARERSGHGFGKRTLRFSWDVDPAVREPLGGDYFATDEQPAQEHVTGIRGIDPQVGDNASIWSTSTDASEQAAKARAVQTNDYDGIWGDLNR